MILPYRSTIVRCLLLMTGCMIFLLLRPPQSHPSSQDHGKRRLKIPSADEFPDRDISEDLAKLSYAIYKIKDGTDPQSVMPDGYVAQSYMDFSNPSPDTEALIVTTTNNNNSKNSASDIIVVFRGTESADDWDTNLDATPVMGRFDNSPSSVRVHRGFQDAAFVTVDVLEDNLRDVLERVFGDGTSTNLENFADGNIYITGSSLGGALAHIVGTHLADRYRGQQFRVINFGAPRFGNQSFKRWSEGTLDNLSIWRFVNRADAVPRLFRVYSHAGHLFQIWRRSSAAYYRQVGGDGYEGVPFHWHFGSSIIQHQIAAYVEFFEEKSSMSRYWATNFE